MISDVGLSVVITGISMTSQSVSDIYLHRPGNYTGIEIYDIDLAKSGNVHCQTLVFAVDLDLGQAQTTCTG